MLMINFAISTNRVDADGFLYFKDIRRVAADGETSLLLQGNLAGLLGGFIFVVDDQIWNSYDRLRFDPEHIRFPSDTLIFSALLLDDLANQVAERPVILCALTEMSSLRIEFVSSRTISITGISAEGQVIYASVVVPFDDLIRELVSASDDLLRIAEQNLTQDVPVTGDVSALHQTNRAFLENWRNSVERQRQFT